ncbi:hypothetical protein [Sulfurimonas sp. HSL-1716]|uniref:hypothetical protein n=1 Tax=Hydrocurvibacter sulfurireducens TaxID=3131937 RepID=UPI0031FA0537
MKNQKNLFFIEDFLKDVFMSKEINNEMIENKTFQKISLNAEFSEAFTPQNIDAKQISDNDLADTDSLYEISSPFLITILPIKNTRHSKIGNEESVKKY